MADCAYGADVFAASAEYDALVGVYYGFFLAVFFFDFKGFCVAEFDAFAACGAFVVVYFWVPGDFVSGYSFIFGF